MGKAKAISQLNIEKINSIKIIFLKNIWGNTAAKQKLCRGNTVAIHIVFFLKKTTKLNFQPT